MTSEEVAEKIRNEQDFVYLKRFGYSLSKLLARYPDGVPEDRIIAAALCITEEEVQTIYNDIVARLREKIV